MAHALPSKALRVAVIQGTRITEDRTVKHRASVSVGAGGTNTFVVSSLPPSFTLFEWLEGVCHLAFTEEMEGRVTVKGVEVSLHEARTRGFARPRKDVFLLPLAEASKGRVVLGDASVVFQFITPRPEPPRPQLPPGVKGLFLGSTDRLFFGILGLSLLVHFSGATFIAMQPQATDRESSMEEAPDRFLKALLPVVRPPPPAKVETSAGEPKRGMRSAGQPTGRVGASARLLERAGLLGVIGAGQGFLQVLGSGPDVATALAGASLTDGAASTSLGVGVAKGATTGSMVGLDPLGTSGVRDVTLVDRGPAQVRGGVSLEGPGVESPEVDREKLSAFVRGRKSAIQQCYERELKRDRGLKGRVVVRFTITSAGRASEIELEESSLGSEAVASCIKTVIRGWVFPFNPPGGVAVAYPFIFAPVD